MWRITGWLQDIATSAAFHTHTHTQKERKNKRKERDREKKIVMWTVQVQFLNYEIS